MPPGNHWVYEERDLVDVKNSVNLLARILIAKIEDEDRLVKIIQETPVVQNDVNWRCRTWVADVLSRLAADGKAVGTSQLDWPSIEGQARRYVGDRTQAGRCGAGMDMSVPKPTWDMIDGREVLK